MIFDLKKKVEVEKKRNKKNEEFLLDIILKKNETKKNCRFLNKIENKLTVFKRENKDNKSKKNKFEENYNFFKDKFFEVQKVVNFSQNVLNITKKHKNVLRKLKNLI